MGRSRNQFDLELFASFRVRERVRKRLGTEQNERVTQQNAFQATKKGSPTKQASTEWREASEKGKHCDWQSIAYRAIDVQTHKWLDSGALWCQPDPQSLSLSLSPYLFSIRFHFRVIGPESAIFYWHFPTLSLTLLWSLKQNSLNSHFHKKNEQKSLLQSTESGQKGDCKNQAAFWDMKLNWFEFNNC